VRPETEHKLAEARAALADMHDSEGDAEFEPYLTSFLNATSGVFDVMHTEYDKVPGFAAWYDSMVKPRINRAGDLRWFIDKRIGAQHHGKVKLRQVFEELTFMPPPHPNPWRPRFRLPAPTRSRISAPPGTPPVKHYKPRWYFMDGNPSDVWTRCYDFLELVAAIAMDCSARFG
jgi:hypothetical protein